ncbi:MAG: hypothetical protein GX851_01055 [Clostridiales bacterium]|nr:hypothetical protein [Clostridiales bacterium]
MSEVTAGVPLDELWWLKENVEKHGKTHMMAENYCYSPQIPTVVSMANDGVFGKLYFGEGDYLHNVRDFTDAVQDGTRPFAEVYGACEWDRCRAVVRGIPCKRRNTNRNAGFQK